MNGHGPHVRSHCYSRVPSRKRMKIKCMARVRASLSIIDNLSPTKGLISEGPRAQGYLLNHPSYVLKPNLLRCSTRFGKGSMHDDHVASVPLLPVVIVAKSCSETHARASNDGKYRLAREREISPSSTKVAEVLWGSIPSPPSYGNWTAT